MGHTRAVAYGLTIEARVRRGQAVLVAVGTVNVEPIDAIHSFQFLKAIQWHLTGAGDKLK